MPIQGQFLSLIFIWGTTWLAIKLQLTQVPREWSVVYRFGLACMVLTSIALFNKTKFSASLKQHGLLIIFGILQFCVNFMCVYKAEQIIPSGLVAIVSALMVFTSPTMARLAFGTKLTPTLITGGTMAVAGVVLMFAKEVSHLDWHDSGAQGFFLALAGVLAVSLATVFISTRSLRALPTQAVVIWGMAYGSCASAVYASFMVGSPSFSFDPHYLAALAFLVLFGSVVAFSFNMNVVRHMGMSKAAYISVLTPIVALTWSTAIEHYHWTLTAILGALVALAGTAVAVRGRR